MGVPAFVMQCLSLKKRAGKPAFCNMPSQNRNRSRVWFDDLPAVAEQESSGRTTAGADDVDGDSDSVGHSIAGDTVDSEKEGDADEIAFALRPRRPYRETQSAVLHPSTTASQRWATSGCSWAIGG